MLNPCIGFGHHSVIWRPMCTKALLYIWLCFAGLGCADESTSDTPIVALDSQLMADVSTRNRVDVGQDKSVLTPDLNSVDSRVDAHRNTDASASADAMVDRGSSGDGMSPDDASIRPDIGRQPDAGRDTDIGMEADAAVEEILVESRPCPAAWVPEPFPQNEDGQWLITGNTNNAENVTSGSCGGGSGQHIYRFTAPRAGRYGFQLRGDGFTPLGAPVIYLRYSCGEPMSEAGCTTTRQSPANTTLNMAAGQDLYVFVDGQPSGGFNTTGGYALEATVIRASEMNDGRAWFNPVSGAARIEVDGTIGTDMPIGFQYLFLDEDDQPIPSRGAAVPQRYALVFEREVREMAADRFSGQLDFDSDIEPMNRAAVRSVSVAVYDFPGALSAPLRMNVQMAESRLAGELCDLGNARTRCPEGTECFVRDPIFDPDPRCHPVGALCPAGWTVTSLLEHEVEPGMYRYEGSLLRGDPPLEIHGVGSCNGATGANDLFEFTAPRAGRYRFTTSGDFGDTILWARTQCGVPGPGAELACNDDLPGLGRFSQIELPLDAAQTIYLFVDSFGAGERGPYTLVGESLL